MLPHMESRNPLVRGPTLVPMTAPTSAAPRTAAASPSPPASPRVAPHVPRTPAPTTFATLLSGRRPLVAPPRIQDHAHARHAHAHALHAPREVKEKEPSRPGGRLEESGEGVDPRDPAVR